jgi:non-canonical (house-cleaning) NTP pyrophosphatase
MFGARGFFMTTTGKFAIRLSIYVGIVAYLLCDLFVFNGPINRRVQASRPDSPESIARAKANGIVAQVFNHGITRGQLDRAVRERLWLEGKEMDSLTPENRKLVRYSALGELIDHQLIRLKVSVNTLELPVSTEEISVRYRQMVARFTDVESMKMAMHSQGISSEMELRERIAARIQQEKYVEKRIAELIKVSDEEISGWYEQNRDALARPEQVEVRHVFLSNIGPAEDARVKLEAALAELTAKTKDFAAIAKEISQDSVTKDTGGALGWVTRDRLPADFAVQLFDLPLNQPTIVRTKSGHHLVEVTARKPAEPRPLEDATTEIRAAVENIKRHRAVNDFRDALRRFEGHRIRIYHDMLAE